MKTHPIVNKVLYVLLAVLALVAFLLMSNVLLYGVFCLMVDVLGMSQQTFVQNIGLLDIGSGVVQVALAFAVYQLVFGGRRRPEPAVASTPKLGALCVLSGLGVSGLSYLWVQLAGLMPFLSESLKSMDQANADVSAGGFWYLLLIAAVVAPVLEELVFRGIVFSSLEKVVGGWFPIVLSAVVFGAFHMNVVQGVYAAAMGFVAALVFARTRNLLLPIAIHVANNLVGVLQTYAPGEAALTASVVVTVVMIVPLAYTVYLMAKKPMKPQVDGGVEELGTAA